MASGNDMKQATNSYSQFIGLVKWGTILSIATVALVIVLIV